MTERVKWLLIILALELVSLFGDYLIKKASLQNGLVGWKQLVMGGLVYGTTAIGWFYTMRFFKLFTIGIVHSIIAIALSMLLSQFVFGEKINSRELIGIVLGFISIILLIRFQG